MSLSDLAIRNAKPREKGYKISDDGGLHLLVQPTGSRLWRLKYRFDGKERLLALGSYPTVALADARRKRDDAKVLLSEGRDPSVERKLQKLQSNNSFESVARLWFAGHAPKLAKSHTTRLLSGLERDIFPAIGSRPVGAIEAPELLAMLRKVEARGLLDTAKRHRQVCGQVFRFAIANALAKRDPSADLRGALKRSPRVQHHAKLPFKELPAFLAKLSRYDGEALTRVAIKFTLLTWARTGEVRFARWEEFEDLEPRFGVKAGQPFDMSRPLWRIPAERMKLHREHIVPLSPQAVAVLNEARQHGRGDLVFPGENGAMSENTMLFGLYRLGYHSRATIHGLRGTASTWANETGRYDRDWIEMQLAHSDEDEVRSAYNAAEYLEPRRAMLRDWGAVIAGLEADEFEALLEG